MKLQIRAVLLFWQQNKTLAIESGCSNSHCARVKLFFRFICLNIIDLSLQHRQIIIITCILLMSGSSLVQGKQDRGHFLLLERKEGEKGHTEMKGCSQGYPD